LAQELMSRIAARALLAAPSGLLRSFARQSTRRFAFLPRVVTCQYLASRQLLGGLSQTALAVAPSAELPAAARLQGSASPPTGPSPDAGARLALRRRRTRGEQALRVLRDATEAEGCISRTNVR